MKKPIKEQDRQDLISAALALVFGGWVYWMTGSITIKKKGGDIGSAFMPQLIACIMMVLGLLLLIGTIRRIAAAKKEKAGSGEGKKGLLPAAESFANLIVFVLIFKPVGFLLSTVVYLVLQMYIMSPERKPSLRTVCIWALIAVAAAVSIYFIFTKAFSLPLPSGILG